MNAVEFLVQGSAPDPYRVVFKKIGSNFTATCTCPAGEAGQHCKHRIRIILSDPTGIVSKNVESVSEVISWVKGTDVESALVDMLDAEKSFEDTKKRLSLLKKRFARLLMD
jgi:uncharacterized Zn finger protein